MPRCLTSRNGWICCGSEDGEFSAARTEKAPRVDDGATQEADADGRSPIRIRDPQSSIAPRSRTLPLPLPRAKSPLRPKSAKLASSRINSITLWSPPTSRPVHQDAYKEPVAVLANNDKTVRMVSLNDFETSEHPQCLDLIEFPDFVNRSVLSPDGCLLVSVLDDPYLYVHRRRAIQSVTVSVFDRAASSSGDSRKYVWERVRRLLLRSQIRGDESERRGSFAACFSGSGSFLAVGTQYGTVSIFDTRLLEERDVDPLVHCFKSSRPDRPSGAIRDMAFCPGVNGDLLAWTEDRGRFGIADGRMGFGRRQIFDITEKDGFKEHSVSDRSDPRLLDACLLPDGGTVDPRLLEYRSDWSDIALSIHNTLDFSGGRRWPRSSDTVAPGALEGFTPAERRLLDVVQEDRRRRDQQRAAGRSADGALEPRAARGTSQRTTNNDPPLLGGAQEEGRQRDLLRTADAWEALMQHDNYPAVNRTRPYADDRTQVDYIDRLFGLDGVVDGLAGLADQPDRMRDRLRDRMVASDTRIWRELRENRQSIDLQARHLDMLQRRRTQHVPPRGSRAARGNRVAELAASRDDDSGQQPVPESAANGLAIISRAEWAAFSNERRRLESSLRQGNLDSPFSSGPIYDMPPSSDNTAGLAWSDNGETL